MTRSPSPEGRQLLQSYVDTAFARFKKVVKSGRPQFREDAEALDKIATGQIFSAEKAEENGLVDRIGFVEDAIERVIELAGVDKSNVRVVAYRRPASLIEAIGFAKVQAEPSLAQLLLEFQVPRAYYLMTF